MKKLCRAWIPVVAVLFTVAFVTASGTAGFYGIVSKVVFEPNDKAPERIQIWGAFTLVDGGIVSNGPTLTPQRGYLYFALTGAESPTQKESVLREWADFKSISGTGEAVAFGRFGYIGPFADELIAERHTETRSYMTLPGLPATTSCRDDRPIRPASAIPASPCAYPVNIGLIKLSTTGNLSAIVKKLQDALGKLGTESN